MEQRLKEYSWEMDGYALRASQAGHKGLTIHDAQTAYRLIPSPPALQNANDHIRMAQETHELKYVFFYLHENEQYFNDRIRTFLSSESEWLSPTRFLDLKLECRYEVLRRFLDYDSDKGTTFLTYIHRYITDALLRNRMREESYSFDSLNEYKTTRRIMQIYSDCGSIDETIRIFTEQTGYTEKAVSEKLIAAWQQHNRLLPAEINDEGENWEQEDELFPDSWDYDDILWSGMAAEKMDKAFHMLSYQDQTLLEQRNAVCMTCGRVSDMKKRASFETLAALFEYSSTIGAEQAYKRAVENLLLNLVKLGQLHCVRLKQISVQRKNKKITAAVYAYQVDNGGDWGEIQFNLKERTAWVETFAENDPCDTWKVTDAAIQAVLTCYGEKLPKKMHIPVLAEA